MTTDNPIYRVQVLGPEHARVFAETVKQLVNVDHLLVRNRYHFSTLGAAHYLDLEDEYTGPQTQVANNFLDLFFCGLINLTCQYVQRMHKIPSNMAMFSPKLALPGFHVFDARGNGQQASIHTDEPIVSDVWGNLKIERTFSYTLVLMLPACGGGLNVWYPDNVGIETGVMKTQPDHTLNYEVGYVYTHESPLYHQIANPGDLGEDEYRITHQGHVLHLENGQNIFYF